jgi:hypothetical protein
MSGTRKYRELKTRERVVVGLAVLLDPTGASEILEADSGRGPALSKAARELLLIPEEVRKPLVGTALREDLERLAQEKD